MSQRKIRQQVNRDSRRLDHFESLRNLRNEKLFGSTEDRNFPDIVNDEDQFQRFKLFRCHTSDAFIQQSICGSCAGQFHRYETKHVPINSIPNLDRLKPSIHHSAHRLYNGLLLYSSTIDSIQGGADSIPFCRSCLSALQEDNS